MRQQKWSKNKKKELCILSIISDNLCNMFGCLQLAPWKQQNNLSMATGRTSAYLVTLHCTLHLSVFADWYIPLMSISYSKKIYTQDLILRVNLLNVIWLDMDYLHQINTLASQHWAIPLQCLSLAHTTTTLKPKVFTASLKKIDTIWKESHITQVAM